MTFTFVTDPFDDIARVRLAVGDIDADVAIFTDELIQGLIDENGSWQKAAVAAVETVITQLLMPNFQADWLRVDNDKAVAGYEKLLARMKSKYGLEQSVVKLSSVQLTRVDADDWIEGYEP